MSSTSEKTTAGPSKKKGWLDNMSDQFPGPLDNMSNFPYGDTPKPSSGGNKPANPPAGNMPNSPGPDDNNSTWPGLDNIPGMDNMSKKTSYNNTKFPPLDNILNSPGSDSKSTSSAGKKSQKSPADNQSWIDGLGNMSNFGADNNLNLPNFPGSDKMSKAPFAVDNFQKLPASNKFNSPWPDNKSIFSGFDKKSKAPSTGNKSVKPPAGNKSNTPWPDNESMFPAFDKKSSFSAGNKSKNPSSDAKSKKAAGDNASIIDVLEKMSDLLAGDDAGELADRKFKKPASDTKSKKPSADTSSDVPLPDNWEELLAEEEAESKKSADKKKSDLLAEQQAALDKHNEAREAKGLKPLEWHPELAKQAEEYAKVLAKKGLMQHSMTPGQGENLAWSSGDVALEKVVADFLSEEKDYHGKPVLQNETYAQFKKYAHYTQIVWDKTTHVGMAKAKAKNGSTFVVARYFPQGNIQGQKPF